MPSKPSAEELAIRQRLKDDFQHYASKCLTIRAKDGASQPFVMNEAQLYIHARAEAQKQKIGRVRAIVLKGRQQGCSTYIEGRLYWLTTHNKGRRAFILAHEQEASNNLFDMASRYHENCPKLVQPSTGAANAKELLFDRLDSGYKVATAGTKAVGRSQTLQYFHGSEVAYWPHAESHASGVMQAVPDLPGTEVWLESTANGRGNYFYTQWKKAEKGESDFIPIFVPWFWQSEYRKEPRDNFIKTEKELKLQEMFGLDDQQIAWRRAKIAELEMDSDFGVTAVSGEDRFAQEYPNTPEEAFDAPIPGAYYAETIQVLNGSGMITDVPYDPNYPVITAWDLGYNDTTAIWFAQNVPGAPRLIDYYENSGMSLEHYAKIVNDKRYTYELHIWPHDGANGSIETGKTRYQTIGNFKINPMVLPREPNVLDGINATRMFLARCVIDKMKCDMGLEALRNYRSEFDETRKCFRPTPYHNWASNGADSARYLAMGFPDQSHAFQKRDRYSRDRKTSANAWARL